MIVVDMESSGIDPSRHSLLSVGAVDFSNPEHTFYGECRIWNGAHVDEEALAVNGFTYKETIDPKKQTDGELVAKFLEWALSCPEKTIAGQNPSADRDFLRAAAFRYHQNWPFAFRTVDLHSIAYAHHVKRGLRPPEKLGHSALSLDKILVYVGLPEEPKPHNGLRGAKYEAEVFSRLFYDRTFFPEFAEYKIPWI